MLLYVQLVQKPNLQSDQAAADSSPAGAADANPMADAAGQNAANPSSNDAATAMEGVVETGKDASPKEAVAADQKVCLTPLCWVQPPRE